MILEILTNILIEFILLSCNDIVRINRAKSADTTELILHIAVDELHLPVNKVGYALIFVFDKVWVVFIDFFGVEIFVSWLIIENDIF